VATCRCSRRRTRRDAWPRADDAPRHGTIARLRHRTR
jgi:hypothetical protein